MRKKRLRSPQQKKALSYELDRRNAYGQNDKAARKAIPLRKAMESRQDRRVVAQRLSIWPAVGEEAADLIESSVRHDVYRIGGWKKSADEPLGKVVSSALEARERRLGRKARSTTALAASDTPDDLDLIAKRLRRLSRWVVRHNPTLDKLAETFDRSADEMQTRAAKLRADS